MAAKKAKQIQKIDLVLIDEPDHILRMSIDTDRIKELADSISAVGQLQPILVVPRGKRFEIVFGHRRYLAIKSLGQTNIIAEVRVLSDEEVALMRATENIDRENLTPMEEAGTYQSLIDRCGWDIDKVSERMGKSPAVIRRRLDLLRMPPALQKAVHGQQISMTVAEELWAIRDIASMEYYLSFAVENGCTREVARQWAKEWKDQVRRSSNPDVGGVQLALSPFEPRPSYVPCDLCNSPVELGKDRLLRVCPGCLGLIKERKGVRE